MVANILRYANFLRSTKDVLSSGDALDRVWEYIAFILLCFFLIGYLLVAFLGTPDLMIAGILFGGSIFVAIVLTLIFRLMKTVKENSLNVAETLIGVIDARDPNLKGHSQYVRNVAMLLYEYLPAEQRRSMNRISLEFAALMHDVGKLGIPEQILNKPAKLTEEEWEVMHDHPNIGVNILQPLNSFQEILPWIKYHHEQLDGSGYYHLNAEEIPYASKVIAVADTYSAITMRRSYKPPRSYEEAIRIMREVAGKQLDAELVEIFCRIPKEKLVNCVPKNVEV
ncbi:MAG: HD domain-containing protein [Lachnospiraceae bacterium]|nr:HD domain-containing protein [Lachnospiraceae bacterium]